MFLNLWSRSTHLQSRRARSGPRTGARRKSRQPLQIEALEVRLAPATHTWTGLATNSRGDPVDDWTRSENWIGGTPFGDPNADLVFPDSVPVDRRVSANFESGLTPIRSIRIDGDSYTIYVGSSSLATDITDDSSNPNVMENNLDGDIALTSGVAHQVSVNNELRLLFIGGSISGPAGDTLVKEGNGTLSLDGRGNTYTGATAVNAGSLDLGTQPGSAVLGPLTIGVSGGGPDAEVQLFNSDQIANTAAVTINSSGTLQLSPVQAGLVNSDTIGSLTMTGGDVETEGGTLTVDGNVTSDAAATPATISGNLSLGAKTHTFTIARGSAQKDMAISAVIQGSGGLTKEGDGTLLFSGDNTYTGATTVDAGALLVNGAQPKSLVTVQNTGTLGGTGTVGQLTATDGGTVSPGVQGPGILNVNGDATLDTRSVFAVDLNGLVAGSGYDQLRVASGVNLDAGKLDLSVGYKPSLGDQFTIIDNLDSGAVDGTFADLPQGATITAGGGTFRISYQGGDGNDVVLTCVGIQRNVAPKVELTSSPNPAAQGRAVTFTATVTAFLLGTPTGTVTFRDGSTALATVPLANGQAVFTTSTLAAGSHAMTAVYNGDNNFDPSTSPVLTQIISLSTPRPPLPPPTQLGQVANGITHSTEHYQDFVTNAYQSYLGRAPDSTGLRAWVTAIQNGLTDEHLEAKFLSSPEYIANHGGSGAGWVRGLYHDLLARTPSDAEVNGWLQALQNGESPEMVAYGFAASAEREGIRVRGDYQIFLGRTPAQSEVDGWVNAFANGLTNESLVADFLASPEYYNSPAKGKGDNLDWINSATQDELQRSPTGSEINSLEAALMPANLSTVANQITHTTEHYQDFVTNAYQSYLGRAPDPTGLSAWVTAMQNGLTDEHLEAKFLSSPEYIANHGGSGAGWVRGLYHDLLGRTPSDAEVNGWLQALANGESPEMVAYGFADSLEREGIRVRDDYFRDLDRTASQSEVDGWVNAFANGLTNESLVADFLASQEYYNASAKGKSDKADWVTSAFLDVLQRAPTADEFASWGGMLQ